MEITLLAFAQARETLGFASRAVACTAEETPRAVLARVAPGAPLDRWRVAVDGEYASWDEALGTAREMAVIPPVSGG